MIGKILGCAAVASALAAANAGTLASSEWISAANVKVADKAEYDGQRAADGTSWFAKDFELKSAPAKATLTASGLGVFELYVNGVKVGDDFLKPGFTHYQKTKYAFSYDVAKLLKSGKNTIAAEVSSGWWSDKVNAYFGKRTAFRCELTADGKPVVVTDTSWKASVAGAVTHAGIFDGEEYDARIAQPVLGAADWPAAVKNDEFKGEILPTAGAEVTLRRDLAVKKGSYSVKKGERIVVDFGQNMAGVPEFVFKAKAGVVFTCLPAEMLNDANKGERGCDDAKGTIYRANLRKPDTCMRLVYTFGGEEKTTYHPRFTFFGFRYIEMSATDDVEVESVAAIPVTSVTKAMEIGSIETGDKALNRFIANVYWGMLSNYLSIPTDCPQRNERQGWTADTQVFTDAGAYIADTQEFFHKWTRDLRDTQTETGAYTGVAPIGEYGNAGAMRIGWADAGVIVPWKIWRQFGDKRIVDENWAAMEKYVDHVAATKYNHVMIEKETGYQYADWLSLEKFESCGDGVHPENCSFVWGVKRCSRRPEAPIYWDFLGANYWLLDARMMLEMARDTGRDTAKWEKMVKEALDFIRTNFINPETGTVMGLFADMQTPAVMLLANDVLDEEGKQATIAALRANLEQNGNLTGFLGCSLLMDTISANGMEDVAVKLMLSHRFPSWLYSVDQGATTIWERWNGWTKEKGFGPVGMNSYNHYAYGQVLGWIYRSLAGIAPDVEKPGFKRIVMKPIFDRRLGYVKAEYKSAAGLIKSHWRYEGDKVIWEFTVPEGATALVTLPGEKTAKEYAAGSHRVERL